jgi:hypothetical protein
MRCHYRAEPKYRTATICRLECYQPPAEPGIPLVSKAKLFEQPFAVDRIPSVKGGPEVYRLPHFDPLPQLCLLELNSNPLLQRVNVVEGWPETWSRKAKHKALVGSSASRK